MPKPLDVHPAHSPETTTSFDRDSKLKLGSASERDNLAKLRNNHRQLRASVQTQTSCCSSTSSSGVSSGSFELQPLPAPPGALIPNSALVRQRASTVSDQLAAASARTGASLPLMIGNRTKCVVNLVGGGESGQATLAFEQQTQPPPPPRPQNTAMRAEQRRQNASVSVVRPVVVVNSSQVDEFAGKQSLLDEWMTFDKTYLDARDAPIATTATATATTTMTSDDGCAGGFLDELLSLTEDERDGLRQRQAFGALAVKSEYDLRQQVALLRREERELNRNVRRQHQFMAQKLEQRRRQLAIIQSVWAQRDFKHAMEKLVDIYQQGLIFTTDEHRRATTNVAAGAATQATQLRSLHTSLAVDVIGIVILRPRLWSLDICQLLLPIINQDLLVPPTPPASRAPSQTGASGPQAQHEYYTEIGLKALRLILTNFSSIIKSTLESLRDSAKLVGVDLSREDRINKCLACYRLLLDSRTILATSSGRHQQTTASTTGNKLAGQQRELQTMLATLFNSIQLEPNILARRMQSGGGPG